jgi:hypothetical protein
LSQNGKKAHDDAGYRKRRKLLMSSITTATRCGRCGKLFGEHPRHSDGSVGRWEVGHVLDAVTHGNAGPLRIEHSVCNRAAGGRVGYARGIGRARETQARQAEPHHPMHYNLTDLHSVGAPPCTRLTGALCQTCIDWRTTHPTKG